MKSAPDFNLGWWLFVWVVCTVVLAISLHRDAQGQEYRVPDPVAAARLQIAHHMAPSLYGGGFVPAPVWGNPWNRVYIPAALPSPYFHYPCPPPVAWPTWPGARR